MFNISILIDRISSVTGFATLPAPLIDNNTLDPKELPTVYVGYSHIMRIPQVPVNMDFLAQHGEDLVQLFEVKIVTDLANITDVWQKVYQSLIDYTPTLTLGSTSSSTNFAYVGGETIQANAKVIDASKWAVGFPTTNVVV